ncbi:MAG: hypothetical protein ACR2QK_01345 [Acidimicrobiales bacterium]
MSNESDRPFRPPGPPDQPPPGSGPPSAASGGYSLLGLLFGLFLGLLVPPIIFGLLASILDSFGSPGVVTILVPAVVAVGVTVGAFVLIIKQMDRSMPKQAAIRTAMLVAGYTSLGIWAVGLLLVGACIAIFVGAY